MKKLVALSFAVSLFLCLFGEIRAKNLEVGAKFPIEKLTQDKKPSDNKIIVFIPSLTYDCEYASMLTQSFYYYFDRRLAFEGLKKSPETQIFFVVKDKQDESKSRQNILGGMHVIFDEKGEMFSAFGINQPSNKSAESTVFLLDEKDFIAHIDKNYRAQGEHLKPLENKLKELNGIYQKVSLDSAKESLKIGNNAPDFQVNGTTKLSDLRGDVVLISFYPAAFSGTLPKPLDVTDLSISEAQIFTDKSNLMSCVRQINLLDLYESNQEAKRIVISSSTNSLLKKWQNVLETDNIEYANDVDYSISQKYFSYNPNGYNNRVSVIVNQNGKIAYIDENFVSADEAILYAKIDELIKKGK